MKNFASYLKSGHENLTPTELLREPASVLMGVSTAAADALKQVGVVSVFDLGANSTFALAGVIVDASQNGSASNRLGLASRDWLTSDTTKLSLDALGKVALEELRCLATGSAAALKTALGVNTIREFSLWPPYLFAKSLVAQEMGTNLSGEEKEEARELVPRFGEFPTERVYYSRLLMLDMGTEVQTQGGAPVRETLNKPISLPEAMAKARNVRRSPGVGAIVTISQSWYAQGITLGHMLHSLALAPGESTRIAIVDWTRKTRASASESVSETEQLDSATSHARALSEVQHGVAREAQSGGAKSTVTSTTESNSRQNTEGGVSLDTFNPFTPSAGVHDSSSASQSAKSTTTGENASWSLGTRSTSAEMVQNINDSTEQHSSAVRNRRASAVREVTQTENEKISTRVVANYNHMHALTVQYYEVVQVYRTVTQLRDVERCLFIPVDLIEFNADLVARYRGALLGAALSNESAGLITDDTTAVSMIVNSRSPILGPWALASSAFKIKTVSEFATSELVSLAAKAVESAVSNAEGSRQRVAADPTVNETPSEAKPMALAWSPAISASISKVIGRPLFRLGSHNPRFPEETELCEVSVEGFSINKVILDKEGSPNTHDLPDGQNWLLITDQTRLIDLDGIRLSTKAAGRSKGKMTLTLSYLGRRFKTEAILVDLPSPGVYTVVTFENDQEDRRRKLLEHLNANRAHYTQAVLRSLDSADIVALLSAYEWNNQPLIQVVEPQPYTVAGNYLVLRAPAEPDENSGVGELSWLALKENRGLNEINPEERLIPIPTAGVFAEAVLGRSNSAEKLDITRFWNWQDSPIPLQAPEIAAIQAGSRGQSEDLKPGQLSQPLLNIVNPTSLPDPAGLGATLSALQNGNMFRDMSGLAQLLETMKSAQVSTTQAATDAGQIASANMRASMQKQVALAQIAADVAKTVITKGAAGGGGPSQGISAEGAKINHGQNMDSRDRGSNNTGNSSGGSAAGGAKNSSSGGKGGLSAGNNGSGSKPDSGDTMNNSPGTNESFAFGRAVDGGQGDIMAGVQAAIQTASNPLSQPSTTGTVTITSKRFAPPDQIDDIADDIFSDLLIAPPGSTTSQVLDFAKNQLSVQGRPFAIFRGDHASSITSLGQSSGPIILPKDRRGEFRETSIDKGIIIFNQSIIHAPSTLVSGKMHYSRDDFRGTMIHELIHAKNNDEKLFLDGWAMTNEFFVDTAIAKGATANSKNAWHTTRSACGELAGRFVSWFALNECASGANGIVKTPPPLCFFARAVEAIMFFSRSSDYDASGYIKDLVADDLSPAGGGKGTKVARQTAIWLKQVAWRYELFDTKLNPNFMVGKELFLEAATAFEHDVNAGLNTWRNPSQSFGFSDDMCGLIIFSKSP